jgi:putative transposase
MPRTPRQLIDLGYYHIITRGNNRRSLFRCESDYDFFLRIVIRYLEKYRIRIFHYCLIPNHIHFLLQAIKAGDLPKFMQGILQVYAFHFRENYHSVGFLFQNRYKSLLIEKESYLLKCARYIERNPLRAKLCDDLFKYPWSSFLFYAEGKKNKIVKTPNPFYLQLSSLQSKRQLQFINYVLEESPYDEIVYKVLS